MSKSQYPGTCKNSICKKCGKNCGWLDRYLYQCRDSFDSENYIPLFSMVNK